MKKYPLLLILFCLFSFPSIAQNTNVFPEDTMRYVEKMPSFPEGIEAMYQYLYKNIHYPAEARKNKISGQVITQFIVGTEGEIRNISVLRGIGYGCDEEAKRVIESMNDGHKWIPGSHKGKPVPVTFTLPIKFVL